MDPGLMSMLESGIFQKPVMVARLPANGVKNEKVRSMIFSYLIIKVAAQRAL
jgi:hypothetical protein